MRQIPSKSSQTRFAVLFLNNDRSSNHFMRKLMDVVKALPQPTRRSITFDRDLKFGNDENSNQESVSTADFVIPRHPDKKNRSRPGKCLGWRTSTKATREEMMKRR